ncbi:NAD(P)-dependent alcohol dehydrogenase [Candidatus Laterigemmans baculatus]|uniref:NAD(P)-dependent alcohol dehydrogenase n=1 Tax=Candidatus Laterigemmans baculatus TaxID=2770505 RepID=UPI001F347B24|nr:NAD(P)-dependent alcohol dehydrogenase [Candidatus Laterigemmans baculatus]
MTTASPAAFDAAAPAPLAVAPKTMQGVFYEDYGGPEVLRYGSLRTPEPHSGQVRIQVVASSVNPIDWRMRQGEMRYLLPGGFPRIPGFDVAGYLEEGGEPWGLARGARVMAFLDSVYGGAYAEWAVCSPHAVSPIPDSLSFEDAAALPLAGSTALQSLRDHGKLCLGDRVLINGASGAVGGYAVQIAKAYGAHVTGVASEGAEAHVRMLGADEFIDYERQNFSEADERWDLIFDAAGKSSFHEARRVLRPRGRFVSTEPSLRGALTSLATLTTSQRGRIMVARSRREDLGELIRLHTVDQLRITVDAILPLHEAPEAHRRSEKHQVRGKLVLRVGG